MNNFVMGVSDDLQEECHLAILYENMNISHLLVHAQYVEEERAKIESSNAKRAGLFNGCSSKGSLDDQDNPRFKKRVSNNLTSSSLSLLMIRCQNFILKSEGTLIHRTRSPLVPIFERVI